MRTFARSLKVIVALAIALVWAVSLGFSTIEATKKTKKPCTYCHVDFQKKPKELTEAGKYYKEKGTLEGYKEKKKN